MRPIFCGNFEYDSRQSDLERLFRRYGKVDRIDMKSGYYSPQWSIQSLAGQITCQGFAFVYMEDDRDAEDAIRALDQTEFGRKGRRIRVEWTKQDRSSRRIESSRKPSANSRPSKTLFVINFDPYNTREKDLERHFDPYGKVLNVRIRKNFAFIHYETQEDASKALDATNLSKLMDRVITVEYAVKDDDERRNGYSPDRSRDRSPRRTRDRSPSPYRRERGSPDYGHNTRGRARSPSPYRRDHRSSPKYGRSPDRGSGRVRSPSPRRERDSDYSRKRSPSPRKDRDSDYSRKKFSSSPRKERSKSNGDVGHLEKRVSPENGRVTSSSPQLEPGERLPSPEDYARDRSPRYSEGESPPPERYGSQSPPVRERSRS